MTIKTITTNARPGRHFAVTLLAIAVTAMPAITLSLSDSHSGFSLHYLSAQPPTGSDKTPRPAIIITGKTDQQLNTELTQAEQELQQAKTEREKTLRRIEQLNKILKRKLDEAQLAQ